MNKQRSIFSIVILSFILNAQVACASPVNINQADAVTIAQSLKGIGLKKAQLIVAFRNENGSFHLVEELTKVKGIGPKLLAKIHTDILLDQP